MSRNQPCKEPGGRERQVCVGVGRTAGAKAPRQDHISMFEELKGLWLRSSEERVRMMLRGKQASGPVKDLYFIPNLRYTH